MNCSQTLGASCVEVSAQNDYHVLFNLFFGCGYNQEYECMFVQDLSNMVVNRCAYTCVLCVILDRKNNINSTKSGESMEHMIVAIFSLETRLWHN